MTALQRIEATRRRLTAATALAAIGWGSAAALGILTVASASTAISPGIILPVFSSVMIAIIGGVMVTAMTLWRNRNVTSRELVALWIEERIPRLNYSLVTSMEPGAPFHGIEAAVAREDIGAVTATAVRRAIVPALLAATVAGGLFYVTSASEFASNAGVLSRLGGRPADAVVTAGNRLVDFEVVITPPAYTGARTITLDDPTSVSALTGSRITISGAGSGANIRAAIGIGRLGVSSRQNRWSVLLTMPGKAAAVAFHDREYERLMVLDPRADAAPRIVLTLPVRDSTLRVARGIVQLSATASDDIGLDGAYFEYLVTTGSGEIFSARTLTTPGVRFGGSRTGSLTATLDLASLKLGQGDVVSMRAIASDRNAVGGPGIAASDTRTFRVARFDEYDSVSVDAAAPAPIDSSAMSQRMLIIMTEELVGREKNLSRAEWVKQSTSIGDMEDRIRKRVDAILNASDSPEDQAHLEEAGHVHSANENAGPANKDLLEAYNALWEAVRSLQIAEPRPALPPMRVALKALDRARLANRLYLRGVPPKVIVDISRVRLAGKEKGLSNIRAPRSATDTARAKLSMRFRDAIEIIENSSPAAVRAFTLLQVDAISVAPSFAAALGDAVHALRSGRDATMPLLRARRALDGEPIATPGLPAWSGGW